jgi:hypothetical protein
MPLLQRHVSVRAVRFPVSWPKPPVRGGTPLLGFIKDRPSTDKSAVRPLPGCPKAALRREDANPRACSALAVPPGSDGLLRTGPAGLLHPATGHGVRHISSSLLWLHPKMLPLLRAFPNGAYTLRSFSLRDSRSASPRPLPSRCCARFPLSAPPCKHGFVVRFRRTLSLRALLHREIRCFRSVLPPSLARCSLGLLLHRT